MRWLWCFLVTFAFLTANVGLTVAQQRLDAKTIVKAADVNNDGYIDRVEYLRRMTDAFFFIDIDKDGFLINSEFQRTIEGVDPKKVDAADGDRDGKISMYEFQKAVDRGFDQADSNGDGLLSIEEVNTRWGSS